MHALSEAPGVRDTEVDGNALAFPNGIGVCAPIRRPPVAATVPFSEILKFLESHGWTLQRIVPPYRVFMKGDQLPILIPVEGKQVSTIYVDKIETIIRNEGERQGD